VILEVMDAAGNDSAIDHVASGFNPRNLISKGMWQDRL